MSKVLTPATLAKFVAKAVQQQPVIDMHTHLYPPAFGTPDRNRIGNLDSSGLLLWGLDEILTYHYLVAEVFRVVPATKLSYEDFWKMPKTAQADHIWNHLFVERTPISEACRGVLTCLQLLGLDAGKKELPRLRKWFAQQDPNQYIDRVMELANVENITMTNAVFDDNERSRWLHDPARLRSDSRFTPVLRIDPILRNWPFAAKKLTEWGYAAGPGTTFSNKNIEEGRRFLREWLDRQQAVYLALSLPPEFRYPAETTRSATAPRSAAEVRANAARGITEVISPEETAQVGQIALEKIVLPVAAERGIPFAMMIGSRLRVNPALGDAGDMVGASDVQSVVRLCAAFPQNKFFCTMLARENMHELCIAARKFGNLMIFGCWWFLNNPSLIEEITRMRVELLGTSMIPQHSDSRVLDQLLYKWTHSRAIIAKVLTDKYADVMATGWKITEADVAADVERLLKGNFLEFLRR